jgi:hypothetical protein
MNKTITTQQTNTNEGQYMTNIEKNKAQNVGNSTNSIGIIHFNYSESLLLSVSVSLYDVKAVKAMLLIFPDNLNILRFGRL